MSKTIRLVVPDWQGGNKPAYHFGAQLLSWLAPENDRQKKIEIAVEEPGEQELSSENGVVAQTAVKRTVRIAAEVPEDEQPDKVITFGGSCLVSQAPFSYLRKRYGNTLGVLWIDSHPDVSTPEVYHHEHAMVLGNLLGAGDPALAIDADCAFSPDQFLYIGMQEPLEAETALLDKLGLTYTVQREHALSSEDIQDWIDRNRFEHIAIHLDLDVLDPTLFRSLYFSEPGVELFPSESGTMTLDLLQSILIKAMENNDVVGFTVAEFLPWDDLNLKRMLGSLSIFDGS